MVLNMSILKRALKLVIIRNR